MVVQPIGFDSDSPCSDQPVASFEADVIDALGAPHAVEEGDEPTRYWQFDADGLTVAVQHDHGAAEAVVFVDAPEVDRAIDALGLVAGAAPRVVWRLDVPDPSRLNEAFG